MLANIGKASRTKNHPSLPWQRVNEFISAIKARNGIAALALEFAILTACRSGEVRGAQWSEIDSKKKIWTIPSCRMKAGREHQVPLSDAALALLARLQETSLISVTASPDSCSSQLIFKGTKGQMLSDMTLTALIRRMNGDAEKPIWTDASGHGVTVHGFRSTFRMWAAEATAYPREVAEHALAHQLPDVVERAYQRGTQFSKRQALMSEWGTFCTTAVQPDRTS